MSFLPFCRYLRPFFVGFLGVFPFFFLKNML